MPRPSRERIDAFLREGAKIARLGTVEPDGMPAVNPVWYEYDGTYIYVIGRARADWVRNLRKNPKVSLCIDTEELIHTRVLIQGRTEFLDEDWHPMGERMAVRYSGPKGLDYIRLSWNWPRAMIRIKPDKVTAWEGAWHPRYYRETA